MERQGISNVLSCNFSFTHVPTFFKLYWSCFISFQCRTCGSFELWIVPRKRNWRSGGIPRNTVCCPTVYIPLIFLLVLTLTNIFFFLKSVGNLRFALPNPPLQFAGVHQATSFGPACPQQNVTIQGFGSLDPNVATSEDCRTAT